MGIEKAMLLRLNIGLSSSDVVQHDKRSARNNGDSQDAQRPLKSAKM
jgi:hypothetical protein